MLSLLVVLFFAATGITLNHPEWVFGNAQTIHTYQGTLPQAGSKGARSTGSRLPRPCGPPTAYEGR